MNSRRSFLLSAASTAMLGYAAWLPAAEQPLVRVWKSRTCGCCGKWVDHMRAAGFKVEVTNVSNVNPYKVEYGVPPELASCHTAVVAGYFVEGHVPADDVIRMLRQQPEIAGIAVPGMPLGSPGMESPNPEAYDVVSLAADGTTAVFASHSP